MRRIILTVFVQSSIEEDLIAVLCFDEPFQSVLTFENTVVTHLQFLVIIPFYIAHEPGLCLRPFRFFSVSTASLSSRCAAEESVQESVHNHQHCC